MRKKSLSSFNQLIKKTVKTKRQGLSKYTSKLYHSGSVTFSVKYFNFFSFLMVLSNRKKYGEFVAVVTEVK
jgi:hypothetical protein